MVVGVLGAGTMGSGIVQVAAQNGHKVVLVDLNEQILKRSNDGLLKIMNRLVEKERITQDQADSTIANVSYSQDIHDFNECGIIIYLMLKILMLNRRCLHNWRKLHRRDVSWLQIQVHYQSHRLVQHCKIQVRLLEFISLILLR